MPNVGESDIDSAKLIGMVIDSRLTGDNHVNSIWQKLCSAIFVLRNLKSFGSLITLEK